MRQSHRLCVALAIGLLVSLGSWYTYTRSFTPHSDWDHMPLAARVLLAGGNPYQAIAERESELGTRLYYPLPAVLVTVPFVALPLLYARSLFVGIGSGLLAYVMLARGWAGLLVFGSAAWLSAFFIAQWSPLLTAAAVLPWLSGILVIKPTSGLALASVAPTRRMVPLGLGLLVLSFVVWPGWVPAWLRETRYGTQFLAPVQRPGGFILLLAFLRWRTAEGRLLGLLACVPHALAPYELLPLFLIPKTFRHMALLTFLTQVSTIATFLTGTDRNLAARMADDWPWFFALVYLPALWMVLRRDSSAGQGAPK
jgi:SAM-dependent methyltransferase